MKSDEELGSEELSFEDLRVIDEHVAGAGKDLDLQSKIFDQILSNNLSNDSSTEELMIVRK